ncbi:MAG: hypothetical protein ABH872_04170 [Candidatus Omnitrophota bacterium]
MKQIFETWRKTFRMLCKHPRIMLPMAIGAALNVLFLYLLYLAPQRPMYYLLGPPVKTFFGERFLHYPFNFYILPKLFSYAEVASGAFIGMLMVAVTIGMVAQVVKGERPSLLVNLIRGIRRYFSLIGIWLIIISLIFIIGKAAVKIIPPSSGIASLFVIAGLFMAAVSVHMIFIYVVPLLIIRQKSFFSSIKENAILLKNLFIPTVMLVMMPAFMYLPFAFLKAKPVFLANKFYPEAVFFFLIAGIIASVLLDMLITVSTTILFLERGRNEA